MSQGNKPLFDLHCTTCTRYTGVGKCGVNQRFIHVPEFGCPLGKWQSAQSTKAKTHILICTQDLAQGGIVSLLYTIARYLPKQYAIRVVYVSDFKFDSEKVPAIEECGVETIPYSLANFTELIEWADVLTFCFTWETNNYEPIIPPARLKYAAGKLRLVAQSHGECIYTTRSTRYQTSIFKQIGNYYTGIAFTPKGMQELEFFGCQNLERVSYPVHPLCAKSFQSIPLDERTTPYRFLYFGRFDPIKGIDKCATLVDSIRKIHTRLPACRNATFTVVGDGWAKPQILESLKPYAHFTTVHAWQPIPQMVDFIQSHDMFLCQSEFEAGPLSSIESLVAGLPVFSCVVGCSDILEKLDPQRRLFSTEGYLFEHMHRTSDPSLCADRVDLMLRYRSQFEPKAASESVLFSVSK
jgi:glycosyltransferase involved in cell wall biosynthesis